MAPRKASTKTGTSSSSAPSSSAPKATKPPAKNTQTKPETFGEAKFGAAVVNKTLVQEAPQTEVKPEVKDEPGTLELKQWVKVLSGEHENRVGTVEGITDDEIKVIFFGGDTFSYHLNEVVGLQPNSNLRPPATPVINTFYREFMVYVGSSVTNIDNVLDGKILRTEGNIRMERSYYGISGEEIGEIMKGLVDSVIEDRKLDIPPYQPPAPKPPEKSSEEISKEIAARHKAEQEAHRAATSFTLDVMCGVQAGALIFTTILPFDKVRQLIDVNLRTIPQEERYQRVPSPARVKGLTNYVTQYPDNYILPSITCTIDGEYEFEPLAPRASVGKLTIEPGTKLHPIDGGHRLNAIGSIVNQSPKLAEEEICIYFVIDRGLKQRRQWFSDINKEQVKPPKAISLEFDRRSREANFHRDVIDEIPLFAKYTERTKGSAGGKGSNNLFVLTWLHGANKLLRPNYTYELDFNYCVQWWTSVVANTPILRSYDPQDPRINPEEVREHLCCTALTLKALATLGKNASLRYRDNLDGIEEFLKPLAQIDWCKSNPEWEGLIIETVSVRAGEKKKILTRNTEQLVEYLKNLLISK